MCSSTKPFQLQVYPNGEFSVHIQRKVDVPPPGVMEPSQGQRERSAELSAHGYEVVSRYLEEFPRKSALGLSTPPNLSTPPKRPSRHGLKGMPGKARKMVRNGCALLEREASRSQLSFVTLTVPPTSFDQMLLIHDSWAKVMTAVRKKILLRLENAGLPSPEIIAVSEIQEERYDKTGFPILHLHVLFVGKKPRGHWAISKEQLRDLWKETIENIIGVEADFTKATRIEGVRKSAENYMGKYMSKGASAVNSVIDAGFEYFLPRQWWGMTRSLSQRIRSKVLFLHEAAKVVWYSLLDGVEGITVWSRDVRIESVTGEKYLVAFYGKFTEQFLRCLPLD